MQFTKLEHSVKNMKWQKLSNDECYAQLDECLKEMTKTNPFAAETVLLLNKCAPMSGDGRMRNYNIP